MFSLLCSASALSQEHSVILDHESKSISNETLFVNSGDTIRFQITNTEPRCFLYNSRAAFVEDEGVPKALTDEIVAQTRVDLPPVRHQPQYNRYTVTITRLNGLDCEMAHMRGDYTFIVDVETLGWALDFGGAFYISDLISSKYYLEPGKSDNGSDGFFVRRNADVENSFSRGLALLVHLKNQRWDLARNIVWAPITFGVGLSESTDYFVGTSLKFGDAMYLTFGTIFADIDEIPIALKEDGFTSSANALDTLGSKSETGLFLSFSYAFGRDLASSRLRGIFQPTPITAGDNP